MSDFVILLLILFLVICLILTLVGFVFYTGLFSEVVIRTGSPPVKNITIAYKFRKGSYKDSGAAFTESCSIGPKLSSVGVFYDDPSQVCSSLLSDSLILEATSPRRVFLKQHFHFKAIYVVICNVLITN